MLIMGIHSLIPYSGREFKVSGASFQVDIFEGKKTQLQGHTRFALELSLVCLNGVTQRVL